VFEVETTNGRTYILDAGSDEDREAWIKALDVCRFGPTPVASLLREASELLRQGRIRPADCAAVRDALREGGDGSASHARKLLAAAECRVAGGGADGDREQRVSLLARSRALSTSLQLLQNATGAAAMVDALASLQEAVSRRDWAGALSDEDLALLERQATEQKERGERENGGGGMIDGDDATSHVVSPKMMGKESEGRRESSSRGVSSDGKEGVDTLSLAMAVGEGADLEQVAEDMVTVCQAHFERDAASMWTPVVEHAYVMALEAFSAALEDARVRARSSGAAEEEEPSGTEDDADATDADDA
jgi:hypothetical protein